MEHKARMAVLVYCAATPAILMSGRSGPSLSVGSQSRSGRDVHRKDRQEKPGHEDRAMWETEQ